MPPPIASRRTLGLVALVAAVCIVAYLTWHPILMAIINVVRPLFVDGAVMSDPASSFQCLKDDPALWVERVRRSRDFVTEHCHGELLDDGRSHFTDESRNLPAVPAPRRTSTKPVPVLFVYWLETRLALNDVTFRTLSLALNTAAKFNDEVVLLLFGNLKDYKLKLLPNVRVKQVYLKNDPIQLALDSFDAPLYKHHSPNPYHYELFCFKRWFAMRKLIDLEQFDDVFVADTDALILTNVTREAELCYRGCHSFGRRVYSIYFTRAAIGEFVDYIHDFYTGRSRARETLKRFGVVSDMIVHMLQVEAQYKERNLTEHTLCQKGMLPAQRAGLVPRNPFEGNLVDFFQDEVGMPVSRREGYADHLFSSVHCQGWRKRLLDAEECGFKHV